MNELILLAEDDPDVQLVARLALKKAGYRVEVVENGRLLLERVRENRPDAILLDWMMPEMDGPETCRHLKADDVTRGIPVIFMTAKKPDGEDSGNQLHEAAGYILKPFDPGRLGEQVATILARART